MKYLSNYRLIVGALTVSSGLLALLCIIVGAMAVDYNFDAFSDPILALQYAGNHKMAGWFLILDMFGYYLLLLPVILYLHQQYKYRSPWTALFTFSGLAYVLIGALGAAILAALWPELMQDHLLAANEDKPLTAGLFKSSTLLVTKGMWNILEVLFAATWWIGIGKLLYSESKVLGVLTIVTGISTLLDATGNIIEFHQLSEIGLNAYLLLAIAWPIVIGVSIWKKTIFSQVGLERNSTSALREDIM
jgi:hypothetical protein